MNAKTEKQLITELESYINNGYLDINSFDNPDDEAAVALSDLYFISKPSCEKYCKIILNSPDVGDCFLDARCLSHLFDLDREYSIDYVRKHIKNMSYPILEAAMDGLCQYSNTFFRKEFSFELISKMKKRYDELSSDEFSKKMMKYSYLMFSETFSKPPNNG